MSRSCLYPLCFLMAISAASQSAASSVLRMDLEALATRADRIIVGTCDDRSAEEADGLLHTRTTFTVHRTLKGPVQDRLSVLLPGGDGDGVRQWIPGMPAFEPGEEVVLFLSAPDRGGRVWPIGLAQGKFAIWLDEDGTPRVTPSDGDMGYIPALGDASAKAAPLARIGGMALEDFETEVLSLVGGEGGVDAR